MKYGPVGILILSSAGWGCADPLIPPQDLLGPRIIAARAEAADDPSRAQLRPNEEAKLRWLVASDEPTDYTATAVWCVAKETNVGLQQCAQEPFSEQSVSGKTDEPTEFDFALPEPHGASNWLAWIGVCERSRPRFNSQSRTFTCEDNEFPLQGVYEGRFAPSSSSAAVNYNPALSDDNFTLNGEPWPSSDLAVGDACADLDLPEVRPGEVLQLQWEAKSEDREPVETKDDYAAAPRESLIFMHISSASGLSRPFSAVTADTEERRFELEFGLDDGFEARASGVAISFFLVVRDERGGSDWERRIVCALPN